MRNGEAGRRRVEGGRTDKQRGEGKTGNYDKRGKNFGSPTL